MTRPYTTLFMLMSVDGKISTGDTDTLDMDTDFPTITGLKEGLQQYYDIEKETDVFSLCTGRVFAKIGFNEKTEEPTKIPVTFVVVDNQPHLTKNGISYLLKKAQRVIIVTTNAHHPAHALQEHDPNLDILQYEKEIDFANVFEKLHTTYGAERVTIQSGGTLNATLVRGGFIDRVLLVVAPALIGGTNTPTLIDGESFHTPTELSGIRALKLTQAKPLENSYLLLEYKIIN